MLSHIVAIILFSQVSGEIAVRPDTAKIPISRYVFGSGDEMTASFSPLGQTQPLIAATKPSLLRFGGIGAEYLNWEADSFGGLMYLDFVDTFIIPIQVNFGVDSFLRLCEAIDAEPILTVNMQTSDIYLAGRMVEYANGDTTTPMGHLRAQRGHPAPYNVKIWSLGNEPDIAGGQFPVPPFGYWTFYRHFLLPFSSWAWDDSTFWTAQTFSDLIPLYTNEMDSNSPIPLEFIFSIAGNPAWVRPVVQPNIDRLDYLDVHYYPYFAWDSIMDTTAYIQALMRTDTIFPAESYVQMFRDSLNAIGAGSIKTIVLEYNAGIIMIPDRFWWNYLCGLFVADCIGHWMHAGLPMAGVYSIHEGSPSSSDFPYFGIIRGDTVSRRMPSHVLELYNTYFGDTLIYSSSNQKNSGYGIECWASKRSSDRKYAMVIVNKSLDTTYTMSLKIKDTLVVMHYYDITNNAPLAAPYNGTTGIVDHGTMFPDSVRQGWTYLTYDFAPASIALFEATPWYGIEESAIRINGSNTLPTVIKKGACLKLPLGDYALYSITGARITQWKKVTEIRIPDVPRGVYFFKTTRSAFRKIIIY
ncbi:MAG TPA: hypothetical protein VF399_11130 [bacterium]